ncbi:MAG: hypothetical protein LBN39_10200, partial [Planctomycetaceae bacterium]|nr:hypothetical protein [Planctomycetaceae bacterium]
ITTLPIVEQNSFDAEGKDAGSIRVFWTLFGDDVINPAVKPEDYILKYKKSSSSADWGSGSADIIVWSPAPTPEDTEVLVTGLEKDTEYQFQLTAIGTNVGASEVYEATSKTLLNPPTGFAFDLAKTTPTAVDLKWDAVTSADYSLELQYRVENAETWTPVALKAGDVSVTVSGLSLQTYAYEFRLRYVRKADSFTSDWVLLATQKIEKQTHDLALVTNQNLGGYDSWTYVPEEWKYRLTSIYAPNARLTGAVNLSDCTYLKEVTVNNNQLTAVNVSGCTSLETLKVQANKIAALTVANTPKLTTLLCYGNNLTFLTLPPKGSMTTYTFVSGTNGQADVAIGTDGVVPQQNYSGLKNFLSAGGGTTTYTWYKSDGAALGSLVTNTGGVFTFDSSLVGQSVYCKMTNTAFSGLTLTTATVKVDASLVPPATPAVSATKPTADSVKLTWNAVAKATYYYVYRSNDNGKSYQTVASNVTATTWTDSNVAAGSYIYAVRAYNDAGRSDAGTVNVAVTGILPAVPNVSYSQPTADSVKLTWNAAAGATSYYVYRSNDGGKSYQAIASKITATTWTDTGVPNGQYLYAVRSYNANGRSGAAEVNVSVGTLPAKPNVSATQPTADSVELTWNPVAGAASYYVYRSNDNGKSYQTIASKITATTWTDTGVPNGQYLYAVRAYNAAGRSDAGTVNVVLGTLPAAPNVSYNTQPASNSVKLTWNPVPGATYYYVYRSNDDGKSYQAIASKITATTWTNTGVAAGSYIYAVRAYNDAGRSDASMVNVTVPAAAAATPPLNMLESVFADDFDALDDEN